MSDIEELHKRIDGMEDKVGLLRDGVAITHTLAALTDREVAGFSRTMRAHTSVLNALRETQVEQGQTLNRHSELLGEQGLKLDRHSELLGEQGEKLTEIGGKLDAVTRSLGVEDPVSDDPTQD